MSTKRRKVNRKGSRTGKRKEKENKEKTGKGNDPPFTKPGPKYPRLLQQERGNLQSWCSEIDAWILPILFTSSLVRAGLYIIIISSATARLGHVPGARVEPEWAEQRAQVIQDLRSDEDHSFSSQE